MLTLLLFALAAAQDVGPVIVTNDPPQGPTPGENRTLSQWHPGTDARMFPDIAIGELMIAGDTLYVRIVNEGRVASQGSIFIAARADANGLRSEPANSRTGRLRAGEARWIPLRGFSVKTASTAGPVFALADASLVSVVARLVPSDAAALDRSGQGADRMIDLNEANNSRTAEGSTIARGQPQ
jgi:hypothetical protein